MRVLSLILLLCLDALICVTVGCDQPKEEEQELQQLTVAQDTLSLPLLTGVKPKLSLTEEAASAVSSWAFYNQLAASIDSLSVSTVGELKTRVAALEQVYENNAIAAEAEVNSSPEMVQTQAIESRLMAIRTHINTLRNELARNAIKVEVLAEGIVKTKNELQHLNLQLNERFSISIRDLLEEFKNESNDEDQLPDPRPPAARPQISTDY